MFTEPKRHFDSGLLWWLVAFATGMTLIELWMRDYGSAGFQATFALLLAIQAATEGRPVGWLRVAQWSLAVLMVALLIARVTGWAS